MNYKIIGKYIKDLKFSIPNPKVFFLLSKDIENYKINIDIRSNQVKENILEVLTSINLTPTQNGFEKIDTKIVYATIVEIPNNKIEKNYDFKKKFSVIILADVLEHIYEDKKILFKLRGILEKNGVIIIFVPAHRMLFSKFDMQIGHFRRYSKKQIINIVPQKMRICELKFIDSIGFFASLFNKFFLKSSNPSLKQVNFWDKFLIPLSRIIDKLLIYKFGKNKN